MNITHATTETVFPIGVFLDDNPVNSVPYSRVNAIFESMLRAVCFSAMLSVPLLSQIADTRLDQALTLFNAGKYQDCYGIVSSYLKQNPSSGPAHKVLGMSEFMLGQPELARADLQKATDLSPRDSDAFYYLGRLYFTADNALAAHTAFQKAVELNPSSVRAENHLGQSLEALGRFEEAEAAYRKAIDLQRDSAKKSEWPYYNLGLLYVHNGRPAESIDYFRRALECNSNFQEAKIKLAVALSDLKQVVEAETLLRDAIRTDETNAEAHYRLAIVLKKSGKNEDSQREFALFEKFRKR